MMQAHTLLLHRWLFSAFTNLRQAPSMQIPIKEAHRADRQKDEGSHLVVAQVAVLRVHKLAPGHLRPDADHLVQTGVDVDAVLLTVPVCLCVCKGTVV